MSRFWKVPKLHPGGTVVCIGGGPSLRGFDLAPVRDSGPEVASIAINNSAVTIAPWADYIFFGDGRWWRWNHARLPDPCGRIITASAAVIRDGRVLRLNKDYNGPICCDPTSVYGLDSGSMALNLAYLMGARRIVLLGYDMQFGPNGESHHHTELPHEFPSDEKNYVTKFAPQYPDMVAWLNRHGVEVVRCTPSTLDCVPEMTLEQALA